MPDDAVIRGSYPIVWRELHGPTYAGWLSVGPGSLTLDGFGDGAHEVAQVTFDDLLSVRMAAASDERLGGRPTLIIEVKPHRRFQIVAVGGLGALREVADALVLAMTPA